MLRLQHICHFFGLIICNFDIDEQILMICGKNVAKKVSSHPRLVLYPQQVRLTIPVDDFSDVVRLKILRGRDLREQKDERQ